MTIFTLKATVYMYKCTY